MPRMKAIPLPKMPDRPGRWKLLMRRQRRLLRPAMLASIVLVGSVVIVSVVHLIGRGPPVRERIASATAGLGMRVEDIDIEGRQKTPEALVRTALGVARGDAILGFSVADARARLEALTWVQEAIVERRLPHTIVVQLTERRPFAVWQNKGKFVLVDRNGDIVTDTEIGPIAKDLPLIVGVGAPQAAAPLLDALDGQPALRPHLVAAVRVGERRWNLRMDNGADILLPEGAEMAALRKLAELQTQDALLDRPLQTVDLRLPDKLVIRPRADSAPQDKPAATPPSPARKPT